MQQLVIHSFVEHTLNEDLLCSGTSIIHSMVHSSEAAQVLENTGEEDLQIAWGRIMVRNACKHHTWTESEGGVWGTPCWEEEHRGTGWLSGGPGKVWSKRKSELDLQAITVPPAQGWMFGERQRGLRDHVSNPGERWMAGTRIVTTG